MISAQNTYDNQNDLAKSISISQIKYLKRTGLYRLLKQTVEQYFHVRNNFFMNIDTHNKEVAENHLQYGYMLLPSVEGNMLDKQQMLSIMNPSHSSLVIAGAGTGKTTTIIEKIRWLLINKSCLLEDILICKSQAHFSYLTYNLIAFIWSSLEYIRISSCLFLVQVFVRTPVTVKSSYHPHIILIFTHAFRNRNEWYDVKRNREHYTCSWIYCCSSLLDLALFFRY